MTLQITLLMVMQEAHKSFISKILQLHVRFGQDILFKSGLVMLMYDGKQWQIPSCNA